VTLKFEGFKLAYKEKTQQKNTITCVVIVVSSDDKILVVES